MNLRASVRSVVGRARARTSSSSRIAARPLRYGASGRRHAGASFVASAEGWPRSGAPWPQFSNQHQSTAQRGMDELHQQTVNLLSFQPLPKDVFDAQVAFNMVARYGQKSQPSLDSVEARISRHYQKIAGPGMPLSLP